MTTPRDGRGDQKADLRMGTSEPGWDRELRRLTPVKRGQMGPFFEEN
jgi:hypothetical protein